MSCAADFGIGLADDHEEGLASIDQPCPLIMLFHAPRMLYPSRPFIGSRSAKSRPDQVTGVAGRAVSSPGTQAAGPVGGRAVSLPSDGLEVDDGMLPPIERPAKWLAKRTGFGARARHRHLVLSLV